MLPGVSYCNMSYSFFLAQEKEKEKSREKEAKEREKKSVNGHLFTTVNSLHPALCQQCNKTLNTKDAVNCTSKNQSIFFCVSVILDL